MRTYQPLGVGLAAAVCWSVATWAQVANPLSEPVEKRGIAVEIRELVQLPDTRGLRPADQDTNPAGGARVSYVRDAPDGPPGEPT